MAMEHHKRKELLSPTVTRVGLLIGTPVAVILGVRVLAWAAVSKTWKSGDVLTAADLNSTLAALDQQSTTLGQRADALDQGMAILGQRVTALESGIGQNVAVISATVAGMTGGVSTASCPAGYKLTMTSLAVVAVTAGGSLPLGAGGSSGWPIGTWVCANQNGILVASLNNYATGSPNSNIVCQGVCVK